jgi:hypothetical protein
MLPCAIPTCYKGRGVAMAFYKNNLLRNNYLAIMSQTVFTAYTEYILGTGLDSTFESTSVLTFYKLEA